MKGSISKDGVVIVAVGCHTVPSKNSPTPISIIAGRPDIIRCIVIHITKPIATMPQSIKMKFMPFSIKSCSFEISLIYYTSLFSCWNSTSLGNHVSCILGNHEIKELLRNFAEWSTFLGNQVERTLNYILAS